MCVYQFAVVQVDEEIKRLRAVMRYKNRIQSYYFLPHSISLFISTPSPAYQYLRNWQNKSLFFHGCVRVFRKFERGHRAYVSENITTYVQREQTEEIILENEKVCLCCQYDQFLLYLTVVFTSDISRSIDVNLSLTTVCFYCYYLLECRFPSCLRSYKKKYQHYHLILFCIIIFSCAALLKKRLQGWKHRKRFLKFRSAIITIQNLRRMFLAKKILKNLKFIYLLSYIQSRVRMLKVRKMYLQKRKASVVISAWIRMILQKKKFIRMIHDIHENNKLSNQLEFLRNQLLREAEARQIAEQVTDCLSPCITNFLLHR